MTPRVLDASTGAAQEGQTNHSEACWEVTGQEPGSCQCCVALQMSGRVSSSKPRKRKSSSEVKRPRRTSATRRRCGTGPKALSAAEGGPVGSGHSEAAGVPQGPSRIVCECHQAAGGRRCSASPELEGQDGKENQRRREDKPEPEDMDCNDTSKSLFPDDDTSKSLFPDDDSNQILPVEQFFGNMDAVQDFPQRSAVTSASVQRERRRRHYYAGEDSDEAEDRCSTAGAE